jgi:hypothetical protein
MKEHNLVDIWRDEHPADLLIGAKLPIQGHV